MDTKCEVVIWNCNLPSKSTLFEITSRSRIIYARERSRFIIYQTYLRILLKISSRERIVVMVFRHAGGIRNYRTFTKEYHCFPVLLFLCIYFSWWICFVIYSRLYRLVIWTHNTHVTLNLNEVTCSCGILLFIKWHEERSNSLCYFETLVHFSLLLWNSPLFYFKTSRIFIVRIFGH